MTVYSRKIKGFIIWLFLSGVFFCLSLLQPAGIFGDSLEYIVQTQSFVFDRTISINTNNRASYWNETNPFGITLTPPTNNNIANSEFVPKEGSQAGGGFGGLYPSKNSSFYFIHSWIYSLACAPVYSALHLFSKQMEYRSFELFNSMALAAAFTFSVSTTFGLAVALLLLMSPLGGYLSWSTPEIFQFALLAIAFSGVGKKLKVFPALLVGITAAQNFPTLAFLFPLALFEIANGEAPRKLSLAYIVAVAIGIFPWLLNQINFGTPNLIVYFGQASISNCSLERFFSFLFSPLVGCFWFFPAYFLLLPVFRFPNDKTGLPDSLARGMLLILTIVLCYSMTGMANFHSQQLGITRYSAWIFAPIAGLLLSTSLSKSARMKLVSLGGILGSLLIIFFYDNQLFLFAKHSRTNYLGLFPEQAKRLYRLSDFNEDPEVLVETLLHKEILAPWAFDSRYEIPLGHDQALCLVSFRSMKNTKLHFGPNQDICAKLEIPEAHSNRWKRSPVLGGYFLQKVIGS